MKKSIFQITIALLVLMCTAFTLSSFESKKTLKTVNAAGSDIEIQYCGSQKFYVLKDGNYGYNVAFIKAN